MTASHASPSSLPARLPMLLAAGAALIGLVWAVESTSLARSAVGQGAALLLSTLISEDLTCVAAGQLARRGELTLAVAITGCTLGIFIGDLALWVAGRALAAIRPQLAERLMSRRREYLTGRVTVAVCVARFVPGLRLPVFLAMGAAAANPVSFALAALLAAVVWTPLLVLVVAYTGESIVRPVEAYLRSGLVSFALAVVAGLGLLKLVPLLASPIGRARLIATLSRIWRWEFWPSWLFYLPLLPYLAWLSLRYRGFITITAANPGIPHGGFVGESKAAILSALDPAYAIPTALIRPMDLEHRAQRLDRSVEAHGWHYPLVLKPDSGQRGAGVRLVQTRGDAIEYLRRRSGPVIVQPFHRGPFEAGIFYYRMPDEPTGHIFAITDKHFPCLIGDGEATLEQLIWRHPRYRMQANVFLQRHAMHRDRVLPMGERFPLAVAGNHCQGAMFRDGSHLSTPALLRRIDQIARNFGGFYFGRFDVRYADVEKFKAGDDLAIVELNGVTSEATSLYDPSWSLLRAYRLLFQQWSILFRIGALNRKLGASRSTRSQLVRAIAGFYRDRSPPALAD